MACVLLSPPKELDRPVKHSHTQSLGVFSRLILGRSPSSRLHVLWMALACIALTWSSLNTLHLRSQLTDARAEVGVLHLELAHLRGRMRRCEFLLDESTDVPPASHP